MIKEPAKNKEIEIVNHISGDLMVYADNHLLQTVFRNLLSNAVKFTPRGGNVLLSARETGNKRVEILVRDSGVGMSPLMVKKLFRLDGQTGRRGTDGEVSTGLGLLLCKEFVEKHAGELGVESAEGQGSIFYFTIPQVRPEVSV
jgi:signal transduction histidine kinase